MDNYERSRQRAQAYFLRFDQTKIIDNWQLEHDAQYLYVTFLNSQYSICRKTGEVTELPIGKPACFEETLSIFDLLCHPGERKSICGTYAPVNSLKGAPKNGGVQTAFHSAFAAFVDNNQDGFRCACTALGAQPVEMGDISFRFLVFKDLSVILKFYRADEDFSAGLTFLWDENALQFVHYETVFYIAGFLAKKIRKQMAE